MSAKQYLILRLQALGLSSDDMAYFVDETRTWTEEEIHQWLLPYERMQITFTYGSAFRTTSTTTTKEMT